MLDGSIYGIRRSSGADDTHRMIKEGDGWQDPIGCSQSSRSQNTYQEYESTSCSYTPLDSKSAALERQEPYFLAVCMFPYPKIGVDRHATFVDTSFIFIDPSFIHSFGRLYVIVSSWNNCRFSLVLFHTTRNTSGHQWVQNHPLVVKLGKTR